MKYLENEFTCQKYKYVYIDRVRFHSVALIEGKRRQIDRLQSIENKALIF